MPTRKQKKQATSMWGPSKKEQSDHIQNMRENMRVDRGETNPEKERRPNPKPGESLSNYVPAEFKTWPIMVQEYVFLPRPCRSENWWKQWDEKWKEFVTSDSARTELDDFTLEEAKAYDEWVRRYI